MSKQFFLIAVVFITACVQNTKDKIVGKWYEKSITKIDDIPITSKGICEYKSDNTWTVIDTMTAVYEEDYFQMGNLNNFNDKNVIITFSGSWEIKDDYLISTFKESSATIDLSNMTYTEKITKLTKDLLITEDEEHKVTTYTRVE